MITRSEDLQTDSKIWSNSGFYVKFLILISIVPWLGYITVGIINEDYLILSWMNPKSIIDVFNNFFQREVGGPYWRPVVWTLDSLTKFLFQYNSVPYHITNILVYSAICLLFYKLMQKLGIEETSARIGAFVFAVLPSHELSVAWIAGRTDTVMALFMLFAVHSYLNDDNSKLFKILSITLFLISALSKEPAYAGVLLPVMLLLKDKKEERNSRQAYIASVVALILVLSILIYRMIFIGGTPFQSSNFDSISTLIFVRNFLLYIPVSFIRADQFEILVHWLRSNFIFALFGWTIVFSLLYLVIRRIKRLNQSERNLFIFGIGWFVIFILPACAKFGQWYSFTASMGLIIAILSLFRIDYKKTTHQTVMVIIILICFAVVTITAFRASKWQYAAKLANSALNDIRYTTAPKDTMIFLAVPDKIDRINAFKIGFSQAVWHRFNNNNIEVSPHLRLEMPDNTTVEYKKLDDYTYMLSAKNARFLRYGSESKAVIVDEKQNYTDGFMQFEIETRTKPEVISTAKVKITDTTLIHKVFVFDGKCFKQPDK